MRRGGGGGGGEEGGEKGGGEEWSVTEVTLGYKKLTPTPTLFVGVLGGRGRESKGSRGRGYPWVWAGGTNFEHALI
jgi:hypothetical protein